MSRLWILATTVALLTIATFSNAADADPEIPPGAKPLTNAEISALLAGRTFSFVVYDAAKSLTGTSTWDAHRKKVYGEYSWDKQSPKKWERKWYIVNGQNCTKPLDEKPAECQNIYLDGDGFIEVTDDGTIHAVSTPVE